MSKKRNKIKKRKSHLRSPYSRGKSLPKYQNNTYEDIFQFTNRAYPMEERLGYWGDTLSPSSALRRKHHNIGTRNLLKGTDYPFYYHEPLRLAPFPTYGAYDMARLQLHKKLQEDYPGYKKEIQKRNKRFLESETYEGRQDRDHDHIEWAKKAGYPGISKEAIEDSIKHVDERENYIAAMMGLLDDYGNPTIHNFYKEATPGTERIYPGPRYYPDRNMLMVDPEYQKDILAELSHPAYFLNNEEFTLIHPRTSLERRAEMYREPGFERSDLYKKGTYSDEDIVHNIVEPKLEEKLKQKAKEHKIEKYNRKLMFNPLEPTPTMRRGGDIPRYQTNTPMQEYLMKYPSRPASDTLEMNEDASFMDIFQNPQFYPNVQGEFMFDPESRKINLMGETAERMDALEEAKREKFRQYQKMYGEEAQQIWDLEERMQWGNTPPVLKNPALNVRYPMPLMRLGGLMKYQNNNPLEEYLIEYPERPHTDTLLYNWGASEQDIYNYPEDYPDTHGFRKKEKVLIHPTRGSKTVVRFDNLDYEKKRMENLRGAMRQKIDRYKDMYDVHGYMPAGTPFTEHRGTGVLLGEEKRQYGTTPPVQQNQRYNVYYPIPLMRGGGGLKGSKDKYPKGKGKTKKYPMVKKGDFAGGGRSYPIPTRG